MVEKKAEMPEDSRRGIKPLGVSRVEGSLVFSVAVPNALECKLKLFREGEAEPQRTIVMSQKDRVGSVFSVALTEKELTATCYLYEALGKEFVDPYAKRIIGLEVFGSVKERKLYGTWDFVEFDWEEDQGPKLTYSEMILYKLHVRGFTMQKNSGVRYKGTYGGVVEKIPYFKELGVNALFLMPVVEFNEVMDDSNSVCGIPKFTKELRYKGSFMDAGQEREEKYKLNYWGYTKRSFHFAPKASYARQPSNCIREFKEMVKELHKQGIEILLDLFFLPKDSLQLILACLQFWTTEYHVDGFRINCEESKAAIIATDPYLASTKILSNYWCTDQLYDGEVEPEYKNLAEYNEGFLTDARRFLKGDEEQVFKLTDRIRKNPTKNGVINYITDHNGFTLSDLYVYDVKHNEANDENNKDGTEYNYSWNCGVEGESRKKKINDLRRVMYKNALSLLLFSQGTPMLLAGDEFLNSQNGNNNAYCQDNDIGWVDWSRKAKNKEIFSFVQLLIQLRKEHPVLHNELSLRGLDYIACGSPDISFHGIKAWYPDYSNYSRSLGVLLNGSYAKKNRKDHDNSCYLLYHMHWDPHVFDLPSIGKEYGWRIILETGKEGKGILSIDGKKQLEVMPRSMILLMSEKIKD